MHRVDFSGNAPLYDRRHGALLPDNVALALTRNLAPSSRILDIGAGTGRVSVTIAQLGFHVIAIEPALPMLQNLRAKAGAIPLQCVAADGSALPLPDTIAEAAVVARLLYLVPNWRALLDAVARVLTKRGLIIHEWGNGRANEEWVVIREKARSLFEEAGVRPTFHPGARTETEVDEHLDDLGFRRVERVSAGAGRMTSISEFLSMIESGEVSYIWNVPEAARDACLPRLRAWVEARFDLGRSTPIPAALEWSVFRRSG
jgi:ubiquinone/menaquinone biosynthesis C-methylase UbiE